ncbi:hypothetical protein BDV26DRAFT_257967 [Aspergillus bertholletiae]|uniref:Zn(2)-C6 fungal-type domain-containing protein n=1 Tax=Aspergillus bertholletiae TaxID=1226010 RepID=A0A5N7BE88_9EURO|nr:hypothetical protein BDV26DRAFT_257967 [Aspergillus bertholletiae]
MSLQPLSCIRCREQKRKCSRENPACSRCCRLGFDCAYPSRWRGHRIEQCGPGSSDNTNASLIVVNGYITSKAHGLELLDVYFSLFIPSTFLCHPSRLKARYNEGNLPTCLRDSIFSIATLLLRSTATINLASDAQPTSEVTSSGEIYAQQARAIVVNQTTHRPSFDVLHTLFNLIVFWCAVGKPQQCREQAKMALASAQQLRAQALASPTEKSREFQHSCFFVSMISQCLADDSERGASSIPFPSECPPPPSEIDLYSPLRGQILTFAEHWIRIRYFVRALHADADLGLQWATLFSLDAKTRSMYSAISPNLPSINGREARESLGLQVLYHMCRFVPHLAMIQLLQKQKSPAEEYVQLCAQIAIRHINRVSDVIMSSIASGRASLLTLPPFAAYCAFTSVSVYLSYLDHCGKNWNDASDPTVYLLRGRLLSNLYLLNRLRRVWIPIRVMWEKIEMDIAALGISSTDVEAYGRPPMNTSSLPDRVNQRSHISSLAKVAEQQVEAEMMLGLTHSVDYVKLADPVYILVGTFRLFQIGRQCSVMPSSTRNSPGTRPTRAFVGDSHHTIQVPPSNPPYPSASRPHRPLPSQGERQTAASLTPTFVLSSATSKYDASTSPIYTSTSLGGADPSLVISSGMLEMMWLSEEDLSCM